MSSGAAEITIPSAISTRYRSPYRPAVDQCPKSPTAGDGNTTALHLASLLAFYERFPAFRGRPLFVAGHSYAGECQGSAQGKFCEWHIGWASRGSVQVV